MGHIKCMGCRWPTEVAGSVWRGGALEGRVRLATRSLFFDPDNVEVPIVRCVSFWALMVSLSSLTCVPFWALMVSVSSLTCVSDI